MIASVVACRNRSVRNTADCGYHVLRRIEAGDCLEGRRMSEREREKMSTLTAGA